MRLLTFARLLGYQNTSIPVFKRRLARMIEADRVEIQRSGYGSDSNKHPKTILIKDERLIEQIRDLRKKARGLAS